MGLSVHIFHLFAFAFTIPRPDHLNGSLRAARLDSSRVASRNVSSERTFWVMEQLILDLNSPATQSSPGRIHDLQREIQLLQREKSAWQTGLDFLHNEQEIIRFYGALTLTIKINTHW